MGYSKSKNAIDRMKAYLDVLVVAAEPVTWKAIEPVKFAQYLREAFTVAEDTKHDRYKDLKKKYRIKSNQKDGIVTAEFKNASHQMEMAIQIRTISKIAIPDVATVAGIVGAAIENKNSHELVFPQAHLNDDDVATLKKWTEYAHYDLANGVEGVILTKRSP